MDDASTPAANTPAPTWSVWDGNRRILVVIGRPGPLISTAPPPPGPAKWQQHQFLSATAESAMHEDQLLKLLHASKSVQEYLEKLKGAGYDIEEEPATP